MKCITFVKIAGIISFISLLFCCPSFCWGQLQKIDLEQALKKSETLELSSIVKDINYIKLETTDDCLIGREGRLYMHNDYLILGSERMFCFDTLGNFRKIISTRGKGPGEYIKCGGMDFSTSENIIYIHDSDNRTLLEIDLEKGFLRNVGGDIGEHVKLISPDHLCNFYPKLSLDLSSYYSIVIKDYEGSIVKRILKQKESSLLNRSKMPIQNHTMYSYYDSITIWDGYNDTIKRISKDLQVTSKYLISLGKQRLPKKLKTGMHSPDYWSEVNQYSFISKLFESKGYFFINCSNKGEYRYVLYNKEKDKEWSMSWDKGFVNDFDGGINFWPQGITTDGRLYLVVSMIALKTHFENNPSSSHTEPTKHQELKKMVDNSDLNDNPIIMLVTLKNN